MQPALLEGVAAIISAISSLLWPLAFIGAAAYFRKEIKHVLAHATRLKLFGQEMEIGAALARLEEQATAAATEVRALPEAEATPQAQIAANVQGVIEEAASAVGVDRSPTEKWESLISLSARIERELRRFFAATGWHQEVRRGAPPRAMFELLSSREKIPMSLMASVRDFWEVRNRLVHGYATHEAELTRALNAGAIILDTILRLPREVNVVYRASVDCYTNSEATQLALYKAVILKTTAPGRNERLRIFPTPITTYEVGKEVSWEWDLGQQYGKTWYRDPESDEVRLAWDSSTAFVGRHLDTL